MSGTLASPSCDQYVGTVSRARALLTHARAEELLSKYLAMGPKSGAQFDHEIYSDHPDQITQKDLCALPLLSVRVKKDKQKELLEGPASKMLARIPRDLILSAVSPTDYEKILGENSDAWQLWEYLHQL